MIDYSAHDTFLLMESTVWSIFHGSEAEGIETKPLWRAPALVRPTDQPRSILQGNGCNCVVQRMTQLDFAIVI